MKVDLTKCIEAVSPWELIFTVDGVDYPTRRPSVGLVTRMSAMKNLQPKDAFDLVQEVFAEPRPDLQTWPPEAILGAMSAYLARFSEESGKNYSAIAARASAMASTTPPISDPATGSSPS